ncbi:MAG: sulfatase/phosphatase domain-containing protein, partial [Cellulophaga baltica]
LKEIDLMDNTILIFTTDNGTSAGAKIEQGGDRLDGFTDKGYNAGMRGIKASMYEGGHRVPLFIHWKDGGITTGTDINELTAHYDIAPTLIDLCGLNLKEDLKFDGKSLKPLMDGKNEEFKDRVVITNSQRIEVPEPWRRTAFMKGDWRLINGAELYDLSTDPEQRTNVADQFPEKVAAFKVEYNTWWNEIAPTYKDEPYIIVGNPTDNPTTLHGHDWHTTAVASPWHQRHIRKGYLDNGYWLVKVAESGRYNVKLRRWPVETHLPLNGIAPVRPTLAGTTVRESVKSKALSIKNARIKVQDQEQRTLVDPNAEFVEFTVALKAGESQLQTWFTLDNEKELGAYYVTVEKLME